MLPSEAFFNPGILVLTALRLRRHGPCLQGLVLVLLLNWLALLVSATCTMPASLKSAPAAAPDCPAEPSASRQGHVPRTDCSFKPCLESRTAPAGFALGADRPELPWVALWLVGLAIGWSGPFRSVAFPRLTGPPSGRRIPLIYRYCTLLN